MLDLQMWIVRTFARSGAIGNMMRTPWGWPLAESVHFIGLCLFVGTILLFDLRLLGVGRRIPIRALHKLVPWGLTGFAMTVVTGMLFLLTEPDQYIYNPAFHYKMFFIVAAGANASLFYLLSYRAATALNAAADAPRVAKIVALVSLTLWLGVIVAGRLLTFYRPSPCESEKTDFLATCLPGYKL
jgi:hypothetical protein